MNIKEKNRLCIECNTIYTEKTAISKPITEKSFALSCPKCCCERYLPIYEDKNNNEYILLSQMLKYPYKFMALK